VLSQFGRWIERVVSRRRREGEREREREKIEGGGG